MAMVRSPCRSVPINVAVVVVVTALCVLTIAGMPPFYYMVQGYSLLNGVMVTPARVNSNSNIVNDIKEPEPIDLGDWLLHPSSSS